MEGYNLYNMIGVILVIGLFYGMYKKSRICAIIILLFSVIHNIFFYNNRHKLIRHNYRFIDYFLLCLLRLWYFCLSQNY